MDERPVARDEAQLEARPHALGVQRQVVRRHRQVVQDQPHAVFLLDLLLQILRSQQQHDNEMSTMLAARGMADSLPAMPCRREHKPRQAEPFDAMTAMLGT